MKCLQSEEVFEKFNVTAVPADKVSSFNCVCCNGIMLNVVLSPCIYSFLNTNSKSKIPSPGRKSAIRPIPNFDGAANSQFSNSLVIVKNIKILY